MPLVRRTPAHQPSWDPTYPTPPHPGGGGGGGGRDRECTVMHALCSCVFPDNTPYCLFHGLSNPC